MHGLTSDRLAQVLRQHGLGDLTGFALIERGNWRQNVAVETSTGKYVVRCRPLFEHQFQIEAEAVQFLTWMAGADLPVQVPFPYVVDDSRRVFPWAFAVMPMLEGHPVELVDMTLPEHANLAREVGVLLAEFQRLPVRPSDLQQYPFFVSGRAADAFGRPRFSATVARCLSKGFLTLAESERVKADLYTLASCLRRSGPSCFVHGDYSVNNMLISGLAGGHITGLLDFSSAHFGDPAEDLPRQLCMYLDLDRSGALAQQVLEGYLGQVACPETVLGSLRYFLLCERLELWEFIRNERVEWVDQRLSFMAWVGRYLELAQAPGG